MLEVFTFAGGAIAAFTLVEAVASRGFRRRLEEEPSVVEALGSAFAFLSTLIYLVFVGFEIALAEKLRQGRGLRASRGPRAS